MYQLILKFCPDLSFCGGQYGVSLVAQRFPQPFFFAECTLHMGHPKRSGVTPQANMTAQVSDFLDILLGRPEDTFRYIVRKPPTADQVADGGESRRPDTPRARCCQPLL